MQNKKTCAGRVCKLNLRYSLFLLLIYFVFQTAVLAQYPTQPYQQGQTQGPQSSTPNLNNPSTPKQEIARFEIKVERDGKTSLPITQVPRLEKDDVIKVRLLDDVINGVKLDQTGWDWTMLVTFINPSINKDRQKSVANEIQFKKTGWYKEYSFVVPYDSQPVLFLSPRPKYRDEVMKVVNRDAASLQKLGEKTIEVAGAYAQIQTFLSELQGVVNQNPYLYNSYTSPYGAPTTGYPNTGYPQTGYGYPNTGYGYPTTGTPGYPGYGTTNPNPFWVDMAVERLARSFNISMPDCWRQSGLVNPSSGYNNTGYTTPPSGYTNGGGYSTGYVGYGDTSGYTGTTGYTNTGSTGYPVPGSWNSQDFVARAQCVARSVNLQDFDISVTRMWQQGGVFFMAELQKRYPQLSYYIAIAAAAIDFMVKVFQKSPLRIVPTLVSTSDNPIQVTGYQQPYGAGIQNGYNTTGYQQNYSPGYQQPVAAQPATPTPVIKISVYAQQMPTDTGFVTAYPIIVNKWQANSDPNKIALNPPALLEPCLHSGQNILKNTDLTDEWSSDTYTRDFKLVVNAPNGFRKEFPLKKNLGMGGWELNLAQTDMAAIPKVNMSLEATVSGMRGFNEISSPKFALPVSLGGTWSIAPESQQAFSVGGHRRISLRNSLSDCRCLQSITYKPSFGGQFVFEVGKRENGLQFSLDGREIWFDVDSTQFQPGAGTLELKTYGGETSTVNIKLYPAEPEITDLRVSRGDDEILITGERLDQLQFIVVNGYKAFLQPGSKPVGDNPAITTRTAVFNDGKARQNADFVNLELGLEDNRVYRFPRPFSVLPARPAIVADDSKEVDGISDAQLTVIDKSAAGTSVDAQLASRKLAVFPINTSTVSLNVRNSLNDYDFKNENISIETRIEKSQTPATDFMKTEFEVLDWKTMRLKFFFYGEMNKIVGGRRIQFRIKDKERGDSQWYTVRQTFVRVPNVTAVKCTNEMDGLCEMKGQGMDYVQQVSVDGGKNWYPKDNGTLTAQPTADGMTAVMIPLVTDKKLLQLKLRDFPNTPGIGITDYTFANLIVKSKLPLKQTSPNVTGVTKEVTANAAGAVPAIKKPDETVPSVPQPAEVKTAAATAIQEPVKANATEPIKKEEGPPKLVRQTPSPVQMPSSVQMLDEVIDIPAPAPKKP